MFQAVHGDLMCLEKDQLGRDQLWRRGSEGDSSSHFLAESVKRAAAEAAGEGERGGGRRSEDPLPPLIRYFHGKYRELEISDLEGFTVGGQSPHWSSPCDPPGGYGFCD